MPTIDHIRDAIASGDKAQAQRLYDEVLSKRGGRGLSGHDQQILTAGIERMEDAGKYEVPVVDEPRPRTRTRSRALKTNAEGDLVESDG